MLFAEGANFTGAALTLLFQTEDAGEKDFRDQERTPIQFKQCASSQQRGLMVRDVRLGPAPERVPGIQAAVMDRASINTRMDEQKTTQRSRADMNQMMPRMAQVLLQEDSMGVHQGCVAGEKEDVSRIDLLMVRTSDYRRFVASRALGAFMQRHNAKRCFVRTLAGNGNAEGRFDFQPWT